jgi:hypothetical protein
VGAKLKIHPYAATYPPMNPDEFEALVEDIKKRGLKRDILLFEGAILDGRNRYEACLKAGVEPRFVEYEGEDALAEVNSLNQYRQMTAGQRALVAARQWMIGDTRSHAPKSVIGNHTGNGQSLQSLSKRFRSSPVSIRQARDLIEKAEDLEAKVDGGMVLAEAYHEWQEREKAKEQHNRDMARIVKYREQVEAGKMKFEEAMRRIVAEEREQQEKEQIEANARQTWLEDFEEHLAWFEAHVCPCKDSEFPWFTQPDSPGMFDHDITSERILEVEKHLARARKLGFEGNHGRTQGSKRRPRSHPHS